MWKEHDNASTDMIQCKQIDFITKCVRVHIGSVFPIMRSTPLGNLLTQKDFAIDTAICN